MKKRGIALITIVILIGFVVMLGAGFYIFIQKFTAERIEEVTQDEECQDISIKILEACYDGTQIKIKVESKGSRSVDNGFLVRIKGEEGVLVPSLPNTVLEGLNINNIIIFYNEEDIGLHGEPKEIEVMPKIKKEDGSPDVCSLQSEKSPISTC